MPGTTSAALPSFSYDQHHKTDAAKRKGRGGVNQEGVAKLLSSLDANKATGPDNIPCHVLKELALEISPVITSICRQSLELSTLPCDWTEAIISPVYKKGSVHLASNYRPISLTYVVCKIMEHIFWTTLISSVYCHHVNMAFARHIRARLSCCWQ